MPLTKEEREFLNAYVYEATAEPFGGPATRDLASRGVHYSDIHWLLTAYHRTYDLERKWPMGIQNPNPPPSPWATLEEAKRRNEELRQEWEPRIRGKREAVASEISATTTGSCRDEKDGDWP